MKGRTIPDQNHIVRFCRPMQVDEGQIQAAAFMLRADEESLSVNWLEFLNCSNRECEIAKIRTIYSETFNRVGARAKSYPEYRRSPKKSTHRKSRWSKS